MQDKIICLVGESGSGKSTIAEQLEKEGYNYIQSYTDRPKRDELEKGHIFITEAEYFQATIQSEFNHNWIAFTFYNGHHYFATKEQYKGKGTSIYVIDPVGVKYLREKVTDAEIVVIYLKCDEYTRFKRMVDRSYNKVTHSGVSINERRRITTTIRHTADKRIINDREAFKIVECNYTIDANRSIENVLYDVKSII